MFPSAVPTPEMYRTIWGIPLIPSVVWGLIRRETRATFVCRFFSTFLYRYAASAVPSRHTTILLKRGGAGSVSLVSIVPVSAYCLVVIKVKSIALLAVSPSMYRLFGRPKAREFRRLPQKREKEKKKTHIHQLCIRTLQKFHTHVRHYSGCGRQWLVPGRRTWRLFNQACMLLLQSLP